MNKAISFLVAVGSCLAVCVLAAMGIQAILGQWAILVWCALGFVVFLGIAQRINA